MQDPRKPRVAIVHYWLISMRGGEKVLESLCDLYPDADIFTLVLDPDAISDKLRRHTIHTSFLQKIPGARRRYQSMLPLMPFALEQFDLTPYDLIISSESGPAKGIIPRADALHICYCHSPMRYVWDHYHLYHARAGRLARLLMPVIAPALRLWDVTTSARVDHFVANSRHVANRIQRFYKRDATVIHPPVAVEDFGPAQPPEDFYLCAGQLVGYKRVDLAVKVTTALNKRLVVIGAGEEMNRLKSIAGPNVEFLGHQSFDVLRDHMARCKALLFPGEEDFGIVPVEVMASGRPVIALNRGGARDSVVDGVTGTLFDEQTEESLKEAVQRFEAGIQSFEPADIRAHAETFDQQVFLDRMSTFIGDALEEHHQSTTAGCALQSKPSMPVMDAPETVPELEDMGAR